MRTKRDRPKGYTDRQIWSTAAILLAAVFLLCGWLAFHGGSVASITSDGHDNKKVQAASLTPDDIRLMNQEGNGFRVGHENQGRAGSFYVVVRFQKQTPVRGENHVTVIVLDDYRDKVSGATVKIEYMMPSLPGRPPVMQYEATAREEKDCYHTDVKVSMKGEWIFRVNVAKGVKEGTFQFPIEITR